MKIGILTVPFNNNYGGFLQAYALKTILRKMGHDVIFINRRRNKLHISLWKKIIGFPLIKFRELRVIRKIKKLSIHTDFFKQRYLAPITTEYYTHNSLKKCLKLGLDAFIVGSDQVWRYKYARESIDDFFFSFLRGLHMPRFSYAASFGIDNNEYPEKYKKICKDLLNEFDAISIRESSGKDLLVNVFQVTPEKVKIVLDPTLLLSPRDYEHLYSHYPQQKNSYLCTYILDQTTEKRDFIKEIVQILKINEITMKAQTGNIEDLKPIDPVEKWLHTIARASFVVTDSFHGTVFSIIFNKPFLVIGNKTRGETRLHSLLDLFDLQSRYIEDIQKFDKVVLLETVNWKSVNSKIDLYKRESFKFIENSIELCKKRAECH